MTPDATRHAYTDALMTLGDLLDDARALAGRYRDDLTRAGWSETSAEDNAGELLIGLQEAAVKCIFGDGGIVVAVGREVTRPGL